MKLAIRVLLLILLVLPYAAGETEAFEAMPPGSLKAFAVVVKSPRVLDRWQGGLPDTGYPAFTRFVAGETAYAAVFVTGYGRDAQSQINLEADFRFQDPKGKILFRRDAYAQARRFMAQEYGFVLLAPTLDIGFDAKDQPGDYRILFAVRDKTNGHQTRDATILSLDFP